jgi:tRNA pseudouridine55 synthase
VDGVLLVDKPAGLTSHDVVDRIRRRFRFRKVGHGGTLDPMATGLLVILVGRGTRLSERVMASDKAYEGVMRLGVRTDTEDVDGRILSEADASGVSEEAVRLAMARRVGDLLQTPPMISAIKKDGVPLYKLARQGRTVERSPRLIHLYEFSLLNYEPPRARFRLSCTKGTYVRTLCADIGEELGCGAFLESLRRLAAGGFRVADAHPLSALLEMEPPAFLDCVIPVHRLEWDHEHGARGG